jgi:hypothetical protein
MFTVLDVNFINYVFHIGLMLLRRFLKHNSQGYIILTELG